MLLILVSELPEKHEEGRPGWDRVEGRNQMSALAISVLTSGVLPGTDELSGDIRALDLWSDDEHGAALFWMGQEVELCGYRRPALAHFNGARSPDGSWRQAGSDACAAPAADTAVANRRPGLYRLGGRASDPVRLTVGAATPGVAAIRLESSVRVHDRPLGREGFFVLGAIDGGPVTYAGATGHDGSILDTPALRL